jgi:spore germination protein GerM
MVGDTHNDAANYSTRSSKAKPAAAADNRCTGHNLSTQATTKAPTRATNYQRNLNIGTATGQQARRPRQRTVTEYLKHGTPASGLLESNGTPEQPTA